MAVNQCSGNSRGFVTPRVAGGQLGNGAMGNAKWRGVRLKDVLAEVIDRVGGRRAFHDRREVENRKGDHAFDSI